jgi:hypothetical protein
MSGQSFGPLRWVGRFKGGEEIEIGDFGIDDDDSVAGEMNEEVGFAFAGVSLFREVAMGAESGVFDDAAEGFLAPAAASLVGAEDAAELESFLGEGLALLGEGFEVFCDIAECEGLGVVALLEPTLVGIELLFERFEQRGNGLLPLVEIAFRGLGESCECFVSEPEEFGLILTEGFGAQGLKALAEVGEGFRVEGAEFAELMFLELAFAGEELFGGGACGIGGGTGGGEFDELLLDVGEGSVAAGELLAQFGEQRIGGPERGGFALAEDPAQEPPNSAPRPRPINP